MFFSHKLSRTIDPVKLQWINYIPYCTNKPGGVHYNITFGLRLSGKDPTIWIVDGQKYCAPNPCMTMLCLQAICEVLFSQGQKPEDYNSRKIMEIALRLNIGDTAYFCRKFKQKTGISPGRYRKNFINGIL